MTKKLIVTPDGIQEVDLTAEEENQLTADNAKFDQEKTDLENAKTARENLKASAKAKLVAGEPLTEDEANTIVI